MAENALMNTEQSAVDDVKHLMNIVAALRNDVFQKDIDYGVIPGTNDKPVLLLPGMEKLMRALHLRAEYVLRTQVEDFDKPLFFYRYECRLIDYESGACIATAIGSANSQETKWSGRWVAKHQVPASLDPAKLPTRGGTISEFDFAIAKAETSGKYGKPAEYWQQFKDAIASGTARKITRPTRNGESEAWEIDATQYRVPNFDIFDQINTIDKIAQKRALSSAIKGAANVSMFFTVDLDDFVPYETSRRAVNTDTGEIVEGTVVEIREVPRPTPQQSQPRSAADAPTGSGESADRSFDAMFPFTLSDQAEVKMHGNSKRIIFRTPEGDAIAYTREPLRGVLPDDVVESMAKPGVYKFPSVRVFYKLVKSDGVERRDVTKVEAKAS